MNQSTSPRGKVVSELLPGVPPATNGTTIGFDAFLPPEMAAKAETIGVKKATMGPRNTFALAILAGAFIALGAVFSITVTASAAGTLPFGLIKLLGGLVFCLGLILVIVAGAELFTGNNLIVIDLRAISRTHDLRSIIGVSFHSVPRLIQCKVNNTAPPNFGGAVLCLKNLMIADR